MSEGRFDLGIPGVVDAEEIGRGGFAVVYRAHQPDFRRDVAVKVIVVPMLDESTRSRFRRECQAIGSLSGHPHIVAVHQSGFTTNGLPFLIMDFVPDGSLEDALTRRGPMPWQDAAQLGIKMAKTLDFAHARHILHRDVKPANILISRFGEPLLVDFGIARAVDTSQASFSAFTSGTPAYAPPETWTDREPAPSGDIYSLGATLHALMTGNPPFASSSGNLLRVLAMVAEEEPPDLRPYGVPEAMASAIEWAMAKDPEGRPQSAGQFAERLQQVVDGGGNRGRAEAAVTVVEPPEAAAGTGAPGAATVVEPPEAAAGTGAPGAATVVEPLEATGSPDPMAGPPQTSSSTPDIASQAGRSTPPLSPPELQTTHSGRRFPGGRAGMVVAAALLVIGAAAGAVSVLGGGGRSIPEGPARLNQPLGLIVDGSGNVLVADSNNGRVVKLGPGGQFSTVAGGGHPSQGNGDGGPATAAHLDSPQALALDPAGDLFIADGSDIRKVAPNGVISTVPVHVPGGQENSISAHAIAIAPDGALVVSTDTDVVRLAGDGTVSVLAGSGETGFLGDGKPATQAELNGARGIAFGPTGELFIADSSNNRVRKLNADGTIATVVGPGGGNVGDGGPALDAQISYPTGISFDARGDLYIVENGANRVRRVDAMTGTITTLAGNADSQSGFGGDGGPATAARFNSPGAVAITTDGTVYVTDVSNNRVRRILPGGTITTVG